MKIFKIIQKHYAVLGIGPPNQLAQKNAFNVRILIGFSLFGYLIASQLVYIFRVANGFIDYIVCICSTSAGIIVFIGFLSIVFQKSTLFKSIKNMEKLINSSKPCQGASILLRKLKWFISIGCKYPESKVFFLKTNRQVERLSEIIFMVMIKIAVHLLMLPKCIASFCDYFMTDAGRDSFILPFPMW